MSSNNSDDVSCEQPRQPQQRAAALESPQGRDSKRCKAEKEGSVSVSKHRGPFEFVEGHVDFDPHPLFLSDCHTFAACVMHEYEEAQGTTTAQHAQKLQQLQHKESMQNVHAQSTQHGQKQHTKKDRIRPPKLDLKTHLKRQPWSEQEQQGQAQSTDEDEPSDDEPEMKVHLYHLNGGDTQLLCSFVLLDGGNFTVGGERGNADVKLPSTAGKERKISRIHGEFSADNTGGALNLWYDNRGRDGTVVNGKTYTGDQYVQINNGDEMVR